MYSSLKNSLIFPTPTQHSTQQKRCLRECGKIVKNTTRTKTQSSTTAATELSLYYGGGRISNSVRLKQNGYAPIRNQRDSCWERGRSYRYQVKNQSFMENYQTKLATYETNKRSVLKDIDRLNTQQSQIKPKIAELNPKSSHFFIQKLKQSLKCSSIQPRTDKQNNTIPKPNQKLTTQTTKKLIKELDQQIRLQNKLRQLKIQINPSNRKQIIETINKFYSIYQYDHEIIMNISYEEYQFVGKDGNEGKAVSADILGEKLIEMYQICQNNWKENLCKKFNGNAIKEIFQLLNFQNKVQLDLKYFTREFNLHFSRNYQPRELYRIYNRIAPLTRSNFIKIFADPTTS